MSKPPSIFSNLDALDAIADLGAAAGNRKSADKRGASTLAAVPQAPRAAVPASPSNDAVYALLLELKRDIEAVKHEQHVQHQPTHQPPGEAQLYSVLAELKRDIDSLRYEQTTHYLPPGEAPLYGVLGELKRDIATLRREQAGLQPLHLQSGEQQLYGMLAELKRDIVQLRTEQSHQAPPPGLASGERQLYAMLADIKREISDLQHAAHEPRGEPGAAILRQSHFKTTAQARLAGSRWSVREAAAFLPLILVALLAAYSFLRPGVRTTTAPPTPATVAAPRLPTGVPATGLLDVLALPAVSPRGVSAQGVDATQALARASALMTDTGAARDTDEAGFWLRRYLVAAHGSDKKLLRSLTQLGSVYAEPTTTRGPDYASARILWEMAAALGDPVGMCFLGRLYENGLGVATDRAIATQWLDRAKDAGGCEAR